MKECWGAIRKITGQKVLAHTLVLTRILDTELRITPGMSVCVIHIPTKIYHVFYRLVLNTQVYILTKRREVVTQSRGQKGFSHTANVKQASLW